MRLIHLKITDEKGFRSLQKDFEIYFLRDWNYAEGGELNPYILAGPNGSGKSNLLEVLAAIFYHLRCIHLDFRPDSFEYEEALNPRGFRSDCSIPNGFELEYCITAPIELNVLSCVEYARIKIVKEEDKSPRFYWENRELFDSEAVIELTSTEAKAVMPDYVLGYSSGENEILSLPFFKMRFVEFDRYRNMLLTDESFSVSEGRFAFLDKDFNQAIVLSNFLLQNSEDLALFKNILGLKRIKRFRIIIRKYIIMDEQRLQEYEELFEAYEDSPEEYRKLTKEIFDSREDNFGNKQKILNITKKLEDIIKNLIKCSTTNYYDTDTDSYYLDYWINDKTKEAFKFYFRSAKGLFNVFQLLLTLNLYSVSDDLKKDLYESESLYINETVPTLPSDQRIMRFKDLYIQKIGIPDDMLSKSFSDGEHQFLHTLGLCLLYKNDQCLFLLDEPETHFNPEWRSQFISSIRSCYKGANPSITREILITTHAPFLVSDSKKEYVLVFYKDLDSRKVEVSRPNYSTLGASINKITLETFGKQETIGGYAKQQLDRISKRLESGESKQELINEAYNFGESVEQILIIKRIMDSMEEDK